MPRLISRCLAVTTLMMGTTLGGCVKRTISISSEPEGALLYLNDREVGRTPVEVEFIYYGTYDVRLIKEGYEPLITNGKAEAPLWDTVPLDLLAEAAPGQPHSRIAWHYVLQPINDDQAGLLERARVLRDRSAELAATPRPPQPAEEPPPTP